MSDMTIEVRCKGGFAYLKGRDGERWLAVPPEDPHHPGGDAHLCRVRIRRDVLLDPNDPRFVDRLPNGISLEPFVMFTNEVSGLEIVGARFAPPKPEALTPLPADGAPNGPVHLDASWASQEFIPNLRRLHPPQREPVSDVQKAAFLMTLPDDTEWHGLAPGSPDMQRCKWDFINQETNQAVIPQQAITDKVGFQVLVPQQTEVRLKTGNTVETVSVDFGAASEHPLFLTAGTENASEAGPDQPFEHFKQLYHLSDPDRKDIVLPVRRCPVTMLPAGDIFCPGGEGEGEDGGG